MQQIVILGGGAAGLATALAAAQSAPAGAVRVTVLDRNPRCGKKLLATGNGRCNLDNTGIAPEQYFTADPAALRPLLAAVDAAAPLEWFAALGLYTRTDEAGRVYPYSNQAADVLALLDSVPMWAACVVVLAVAVVLGILYTVLSNRMQIPLFYLSLCVHLLLDGLNGFFYRMTRQTSNYAYAGADRTRWLGVPLWCWVALAALALGTAYLNRTTYGRSLFLLPWYHDVRWQEIGESRRIKTGTRLKLDLILGAVNVLSCVLVGLSGILLALRGGTTAFYSGMNYTCRILTAASIGGWMNATRRSLPVGALLGSMSLVLILMLEVHLRISSSYVEYCLSAVLILLSAAWGSVQKKKRLQPKNRIT